MKTRSFILASALFLSLAALQAQAPGAPDSSFAVNGRFLDDALGNVEDDYATDAAVLPGGKIMLVGTAVTGNSPDIVLVRLNADGTRDNSFGNSGASAIDLSLGGSDYGERILVQPDGKMLICGAAPGPNDADIFVIRLNEDGSFDESFGTGGSILLDFGGDDAGIAMALGENGRIIVGGTSQNGMQSIVIAALTSAGVADNGFSADGMEVIDGGGSSLALFEMVTGSDGDIFFCGSTEPNTAIVGKVLANGGLDNTFAGDGILEYQHFGENSILMDIVAGQNGEIWAAGGYLSQVGAAGFIIKLNADGTPDQAFDTDGANEYFFQAGQETLLFTDMALTSDGILCGGALANRYLTVMFDFADGGLSNSYGTGGFADNESNASFTTALQRMINLDADRVLMVGYYMPSTTDMVAMALNARNPQTVSVQNIVSLAPGIFPNPATESFRLDIPGGATVQSVEVYNIAGQRIHTFSGNQQQYAIPAGMQPGTYILNIHTENGINSARIIIK